MASRRLAAPMRRFSLSPPCSAPSAVFTPSFARFSTTPQQLQTAPTPPPVFQATNTSVFPFHSPKEPLLANLSFTLNDSDCWAILSPSSSSPTKATLLAVIQQHVRYSPPTSASHPILDVLPDIQAPASEGGPRRPEVQDIIKFVSFKTRLGGGGEFEDFSARYFSIRDEDKLTVREHLRMTTGQEDGPIEETARELQMETFLDLPLITLSNGQTRRARILKALLAKPELLILEEPFTGLDVASRALLTSLLSTLHSARSPRILLILRPQDAMPPFVSHIALVDSPEPGGLLLGTKEEVLATREAAELLEAGERERAVAREKKERRRVEAREREARGEEEKGKKVVELKGVNVTYGREEPRRVLQDVDWTIREGERWVLMGHNGSGKSTLLSIILGDHPRSFTEDIHLFGKPRGRQATSQIQEKIGHVSPEIYNAFPRKYGRDGLTAFEAIITGFEAVYTYRKATPSQSAAVTSLLASLAHPTLTPEFLTRDFASLTPGEQSLILLLRALAKRPPLLILDECFSGMDKNTVEIVRRFIDEGLEEHQAVILISHFEEEIPDGCMRSLMLEGGKVVERI